MPQPERDSYTLQDFIVCGASFVGRALLRLHTYIGRHIDFYRIDETVSDAAREKSQTFKYLRAHKKGGVEDEIIELLSRDARTNAGHAGEYDQGVRREQW